MRPGTLRSKVQIQLPPGTRGEWGVLPHRLICPPRERRPGKMLRGGRDVFLSGGRFLCYAPWVSEEGCCLEFFGRSRNRQYPPKIGAKKEDRPPTPIRMSIQVGASPLKNGSFQLHLHAITPMTPQTTNRTRETTSSAVSRSPSVRPVAVPATRCLSLCTPPNAVSCCLGGLPRTVPFTAYSMPLPYSSYQNWIKREAPDRDLHTHPRKVLTVSSCPLIRG